tara:strand:- start:235 stop:351 length:117 start_codon:yes stop_codon:yes gene_type:complete
MFVVVADAEWEANGEWFAEVTGDEEAGFESSRRTTFFG